MQNNENQTNQADIPNHDINLEQEMKELNSVEQSSNTVVPTDEYSKKGINPIFSKKVLPYYDPSVLSTNSEALDTVGYYYDRLVAMIKAYHSYFMKYKVIH